jgi:hypothetical protein
VGTHSRASLAWSFLGDQLRNGIVSPLGRAGGEIVSEWLSSHHESGLVRGSLRLHSCSLLYKRVHCD